MKNLKIKIATLGLAGLATACGRPGRHVVISQGDNFSSLKIEYYGRAFFSDDSTSITRISPNGSVQYKKGGQSLLAERDGRGDITYRINDGQKQKSLSADDKKFLAQAVKDMIKVGHNSN